MQCRVGEQVCGGHARTNRFFCIGSDWYFSARENLRIGPFGNRDDAEIEAQLFLRHICEGGALSRRFYNQRYAGRLY